MKRWKITEKRSKINNIVNNLLDINYMFRRIDFLESAISILLDEHQLKGVYLSRQNIKEFDNHFKKHRIRDRVVKYLNKKNIK